MMSSSEDSGLQVKSGVDITVKVTGVEGGSVLRAKTSGCTFGPGATVNRFKYETWNPNEEKVDSLQERTKREITNKTHHCIKTRSLSKVLEIFQGNGKCVTITGLPGDGKTTLAYMALGELQQDAKVFAVHSATDYFTITSVRCSQDIYIMINDIFGLSVFERDRLRHWSDVLEDVLTDQATDSHIPNLRHIKLLLVGRQNVVNEALDYLGKFETLVNCEDCLVDLSSPSYELSFHERVQIFEVYSKQSIDEQTRDEVCALSNPHGFPNCCAMFFSMMKQRKLNPTEFFTNPIRFLMESIKVLIVEKPAYKRLFKEIIQMDGELDLSTIRQRKPLLKDEERRKAINELRGSFIEERFNTVVFKYPTIFEHVTILMETLKD